MNAGMYVQMHFFKLSFRYSNEKKEHLQIQLFKLKVFKSLNKKYLSNFQSILIAPFPPFYLFFFHAFSSLRVIYTSNWFFACCFPIGCFLFLFSFSIFLFFISVFIFVGVERILH